MSVDLLGGIAIIIGVIVIGFILTKADDYASSKLLMKSFNELENENQLMILKALNKEIQKQKKIRDDINNEKVSIFGRK